jgi:AhpC/TSA family
MRKLRLSAVWLSLLALAVVQVPRALRANSKVRSDKSAPMTLKVGDSAPDFSLLAFDGSNVKKVSLADYRGKKNVALAFYVFAFTGG